MTTLPRLYRTTLKQFVKNSIHPRAKRSPTIPAHLREVFDSARSAKAGSAEAVKFEKDIDNMVVFLNAHRIHKELVERYNPTSGMTNDERSRKSAKMVGLDYPEPFEAGVAPTMEGAKAKRLKDEQQGDAESGKGSLRTVSVKSML